MKVFVGYEVNCPHLAADCESITDVNVFSSRQQAIHWFCERILNGMKEGFIVEEGYPVESLFNGFIGKDTIALTMFRDHQDNWDAYYDIVLEEKEVQ